MSLCTICEKEHDPAEHDPDMFYCGICELEHELWDTGCVRGDPDNVLISYENKHGV